MTIIDKEVLVGIGNNLTYYENLGYKIPKYKDKSRSIKVKIGTKILVKIDDLPKGTGTEVKYICDYCDGENQIEEKDKYKAYYKIINGRKIINKDCCGNKYCQAKKRAEIRKSKPIPKEESLGGKYPHLISEWSDKNKKTPFEYTYGSGDAVWWYCFKCKSVYDMPIYLRGNMGCGCPYCAGKRVNHTNSLFVTNPEVAKLLKNKERGRELTSYSNKKEIFVCKDCGNSSKPKPISRVVQQGFSCEFCGDGMYYPEKFVFNMLNQLNVKFKKEKVFSWSKNVKNKNKNLSKNKKYDFYIPSLNCIIETHGQQHYSKTFEKIGGRSLEDEQDNDEIKEELAIENGIGNYIVIDCSISDLDFIKSNILDSKLSELLDLRNVNWEECHKFAISSIVKKACNLWSKYKNVKEISMVIKVDKATVVRYLKQGRKIGLCDYNPQEEGDKTRKKNLEKAIETRSSKVVQISKDGEFIKEWSMVADAQRYYKINNILAVCNGKQKSAGGFMWMYKEDYENNKDNIKSYVDPRKSIFDIVQLSFEGELIKVWNGLNEITNSLNLAESSIRSAINGHIKSVGGFIWMTKDYYEENKDNLKLYKPKSRRRAVIKLDVNGNFLCEYNSISLAIKDLGGGSTSKIMKITSVCNGEQETYQGFRWMYKEDYERIKNN